MGIRQGKFGGVIEPLIDTATATELWPRGLVELAEASGLTPCATIAREWPQGGVGPRSETTMIKKLTAQLRVAGEVALRLGAESTRRMADAFGAAGFAVALIGRDGRVIHLNARFERCVGDGVHIEGGRLGSWKSEVDRALTHALDQALHHDRAPRQSPAPIVLPRRSGRRPLLAQVIPVTGRAHDLARHVSAIVTLTDLEVGHGSPSEAMLQQAFDLTPAEARLAALIAAGKSLPDIARADGIAHETLRSQLKAIFAKTGTARQAELALLLSRFARS